MLYLAVWGLDVLSLSCHLGKSHEHVLARDPTVIKADDYQDILQVSNHCMVGLQTRVRFGKEAN